MSAEKMAAALAPHLSSKARQLLATPGITPGVVAACADSVRRLDPSPAAQAEAVALAAVAEVLRWEEASQPPADVAALAASYVAARSAAAEAVARAGVGYTRRCGTGPGGEDRPRGGDVYSTGEPPVEYVLDVHVDPFVGTRYIMRRAVRDEEGGTFRWLVSDDFLAECWTRRGRSPEALTADVALEVEERALDALVKAVRPPVAAPNR